jgi:hypothetical protein
MVNPQDMEPPSPLKPGQPIALDLLLSNVGHQPAFQYDGKLRMDRLDLPAASAPDKIIPPRNDACDGLKLKPGSGVIYPGASLHIRGAVVREGDPKLPDDVLAGTAIAAYQGCTIYQTMGEGHFSKYCFYLHQSVVRQQPQWSTCPVGNDAD